MDPASASVAFVGFAASLTTLLALVLDTSTTIYNAQRKFRHAPEDIKRLLTQLVQLEHLLHEVRQQIQDHPDQGGAPGVIALLTSATQHLHADMLSFKRVTQKLNAILYAPPARKKLLVLRIRLILQTSTVQEYQHLISSHIEVLTLLFGMLNR